MRLVSLISGGIDSPVAAYMMANVGADVILLHMDNRPYSDDRTIEKVKLLAEQLRRVSGKDMPLYIASHGMSQTAIGKKCGGYQCVMCKRTMMSVAAGFAERNGCSGVIMGDSLGQVASQTLKNLFAESAGIAVPIVRPLIGMDKIEIENIGKRIGTYEISIRPEKPCAALPPRPVTAASAGKIEELQSKLDFCQMITDSLDSVQLISGMR
jgi:thiamine biosynthesis protein ThiI